MLKFRHKLLWKVEKPRKKFLKLLEKHEFPIIDEKGKRIGRVENVKYEKAYKAFMGDLIFEKGPFWKGYQPVIEVSKKRISFLVMNTRRPESKKFILKW